MKKIAYFAGGVAVAASMATIAGQVTGLTTFTSGTTIKSSEVNGNFSTIQTAVNDNDNRITALENGSGCPSDMVAVGPICVDKYEASVWNAATGGNQITDLTTTTCAANGSDCTGIYARSEAGVMPAVNITWFQAQQACANVGKRLLTNAEWQMAAAGTPTGAPATGCNNNNPSVQPTGADYDNDPATSCESSFGVFDMTGNVNEWVADWVIDDDTSSAKYGTAGTNSFITAVYRGGGPGGGDIFTYNAAQQPDFTAGVVGFRCAK